jgi:hypothetical protein
VSTPARNDALLWLFASAVAFLFALYPLSATLVAGVYVPGDHDSFYHAHRILDSIAAPAHMYQFDPRIHAPEGSWITWPWAYDMLMAWLGHLAVYGFGVAQPLAVLVYVAPCWVAVNMALMLGVANRLELSLPLKIVALTGYAMSPLTQELHRVGMLDHHYVEHTFVLATVLFGLRWLQAIENPRRAVALGVVLGLAPAFHNGLFILQLPVLITLAIRWLLGRRLAERATVAFAASLLLSTFVFLLPSEPFRNGDFDFALQSWFHLLIAASSSLFVCLLARLRRAWGSFVVLAAVSIALLAFIAAQALRAGTFLTGHLVKLDQIDEVAGILDLVRIDWVRTLATYSGLLCIAPIALVYIVWRLRRTSADGHLFFVVVSWCGAALMVFQYRFQNYGSFALYFPALLMTQDAINRWPSAHRWIIAATAAIAIASFLPGVRGLYDRIPLGGNTDYQMTREIYPDLARACEKNPGIVIADSDDGHYITYHTRCSVIADNFIMTRQHEEKLLEVDKLLSASPEEALRMMPQARYIYVRRKDPFLSSDCARRACEENRGLRQDLLFSNSFARWGLRLIATFDFQRDSTHQEPFARIFEVAEPAGAAAVIATPN